MHPPFPCPRRRPVTTYIHTTQPVDGRLGSLVAAAPSGTTLPALETDKAGMATATATSVPVLQTAAATGLGGGGGLDREGIKGVPAGHTFRPMGAWVGRRPGVGCGGGGGASACGRQWEGAGSSLVNGDYNPGTAVY